MIESKREWYKLLKGKLHLYVKTQGLMQLLLLISIGLYFYLITKGGLTATIIISLLPLSILAIVLILKNTRSSFYVLYALQFILMAAGMFVDLKLGVSTLMLTLSIFILFIIHNIYRPIDFSQSQNLMTYVFIIYGVFCILEIANPNNVMEAWNIAITQYLVYPLLCAILVPIAIRSTKGIEWLLFIWSLFIIVGTVKGYWQKNYGFNAREMYFLYELGGARTHILSTGVRYFSCFTDAANYGVHMGMATICFGISIFYVKSNLLKIYFSFVVLGAIYSMLISGTRSAIPLPMIGMFLYIILIRNKTAFILGLIAVALVFVFFRFTTIGEGNAQIRRMRTAFNPTEDASYQLRVANRERMKELMVRKPIGYGLGLSKGERFYPKERMPYPPDSWLVSVWVETGIIGLLLYLGVHGVLFAWCSWIIMFRIHNKRLRGLLTAWLSMNAGFFVVAYANDIMQYPNGITIYTGFALCFAGLYIDKELTRKSLSESEKLPLS